MKNSILYIVAILAISITTSSFKGIPEYTNENIAYCNPPTLRFYDPETGSLVTPPLCRFKNYEVSIFGTANAVITSITGGTLSGKNGCDYPCSWIIRPTTTSGLAIQIYGQCVINGQLVNSPTAAYNYSVVICPK